MQVSLASLFAVVSAIECALGCLCSVLVTGGAGSAAAAFAAGGAAVSLAVTYAVGTILVGQPLAAVLSLVRASATRGGDVSEAASNVQRMGLSETAPVREVAEMVDAVVVLCTTVQELDAFAPPESPGDTYDDTDEFDTSWGRTVSADLTALARPDHRGPRGSITSLDGDFIPGITSPTALAGGFPVIGPPSPAAFLRSPTAGGSKGTGPSPSRTGSGLLTANTPPTFGHSNPLTGAATASALGVGGGGLMAKRRFTLPSVQSQDPQRLSRGHSGQSDRRSDNGGTSPNVDSGPFGTSPRANGLWGEQASPRNLGSVSPRNMKGPPRRVIQPVALAKRKAVGCVHWRHTLSPGPPEDICFILCTLLDDLASISRQEGAVLSWCGGDSVQAHFNARGANAPADPATIIRCVTQVSERIDRAAEELVERSYPSLKVWCGCALSDAVCGTVGSNRFKSFVVLGAPTQDAELASMVAQEYKAGVVCTEAFLGSTRDCRFRDLGAFARCAEGAQVALYQVMTPSLDELQIDNYQNAFSRTLAEDWVQAQFFLRQHLAQEESDFVAERLLTQVRNRWKPGGVKSGDRALRLVLTSTCPQFLWDKMQATAPPDPVAVDQTSEGRSIADSEHSVLERRASERENLEQSKLFASVLQARRLRSQGKMSLRNVAAQLRRASAGTPPPSSLAPQGTPKDEEDEDGPLRNLTRVNSQTGMSETGTRTPRITSPTPGTCALSPAKSPPPLKASKQQTQETPASPKLAEDALLPTVMRQPSRIHFGTQEQLQTELQREKRVRLLNLWKALTLFLLMYNAFLVPLRWGFNWRGVHPVVIALNFVADVGIYYIKIGLSLVTPFEEEARWVTDPARIRAKYARGDLLVDLLAAFPLELLALTWERPLVEAFYNPYYRSNRVLNLIKLPDYFDDAFRYWAPKLNPIVVRIQQFIICTVFVLHFIACILGAVILEDDAWDPDNAGRIFVVAEHEESSLFHRYMLCLDWAVRAVPGYGHRWPLSDLQVTFALLVSIVGVALYATIIAVISSLVTSLGAYEDQFRTKMDELQDYIHYSKMPKALADEILGYYRYLWRTQKTLSAAESPLNDLPEELTQRVNFTINTNIMRKVPLFAAVKDNEEFIVDLVSCLTLSVMLPDTYIFSFGDIGNAMYFIGQGRVRIEDRHCTPLADLGEGAFFGEVALLYGTPRTASVKALSYTHAYVLTKRQFTIIGQKYPDCLVEILMTAEQRLAVGNQNSLSDREKQLLVKIFIRRNSGEAKVINPKGNWGKAWRAFRRNKEKKHMSVFRRRMTETMEQIEASTRSRPSTPGSPGREEIATPPHQELPKNSTGIERTGTSPFVHASPTSDAKRVKLINSPGIVPGATDSHPPRRSSVAAERLAAAGAVLMMNSSRRVSWGKGLTPSTEASGEAAVSPQPAEARLLPPSPPVAAGVSQPKMGDSLVLMPRKGGGGGGAAVVESTSPEGLTQNATAAPLENDKSAAAFVVAPPGRRSRPASALGPSPVPGPDPDTGPKDDV
eukprot:Hpha_TRINITY_DN8273_c0_g1::TRINITY_DN8273_c0_g1_i1::g.111940::m.111940